MFVRSVVILALGMGAVAIPTPPQAQPSTGTSSAAPAAGGAPATVPPPTSDAKTIPDVLQLTDIKVYPGKKITFNYASGRHATKEAKEYTYTEKGECTGPVNEEGDFSNIKVGNCTNGLITFIASEKRIAIDYTNAGNVTGTDGKPKFQSLSCGGHTALNLTDTESKEYKSQKEAIIDVGSMNVLQKQIESHVKNTLLGMSHMLHGIANIFGGGKPAEPPIGGPNPAGHAHHHHHHKDKDAAGSSTPAAGGNTPAAGGNTPAAGGNTPAAGGSSPATGGTASAASIPGTSPAKSS